MSKQGIDKFFALARERYSILEKRKAGLPKPWSADPIFQREYFCNVFRESDKTTEWFRENIRNKVDGDCYQSLLAIAAFRWFNKIETGIILKPFLLGNWSSEAISERLLGASPVVTGAYIIKTPDKMNKMTGVLWCIDRFIENMNANLFDKIMLQDYFTMQKAWELLKQSPFIGNFMSWQICSDARQTCLLIDAPDRDAWAPAGPGTTRGISRTYTGDVDYYGYNSASDQDTMLGLMRELAEFSKDAKYWPKEWSPLAVIDIAHWACEVDKYYRAEEGGRMKRKYK